ncbi:MAG: aldo/keto reductase [Clostridiales bacterium]|jgi:aryl-alcohol dehydrogenase-like predicted oxidoreductase|nr:aldo/keto reductase [Clostridiales bacterium]
MQYVTLRGIDRPVSRLVFGCAYPGMIEGRDESRWLDSVYGMGFTAFDTAENYGKSEEVLGNWMASRGIREELTVITKGCHPYEGRPRVSPGHLKRDFEQSLERLKTGYVDVYLLHRDDPEKPVGAILEALDSYVRAGKIRRIGASNWTLERFREANAYARERGLEPFSFTSPNYALARQVRDPWGGGCTSLSGEERAEERRWYGENGVDVIAYSSLAHGFLSGKVSSAEPDRLEALLDEGGRRGYMSPDNLERLARAERLAKERGRTVPEIALAYVLADPIGILPAVSATKKEHLERNVSALDLHLTREECAWLDLRT